MQSSIGGFQGESVKVPRALSESLESRLRNVIHSCICVGVYVCIYAHPFYTSRLVFHSMVLTSPHTNDTILAPLDHVTVLQTHAFYRGRRCLALFSSVHASTTVPLARLQLIVHLDHILACGRDYSPVVECHSRDRVVVSICIINRPSPKVPYLRG